MDITERKITKIAREAEKLVLLTMRDAGVGTAEIDLIHALRHNPGCTQAKLAELLHTDKAAIARRTKNLLSEGRICQYKRGNAECADDAERRGICNDSVLQDRQHGVRKCLRRNDAGQMVNRLLHAPEK